MPPGIKRIRGVISGWAEGLSGRAGHGFQNPGASPGRRQGYGPQLSNAAVLSVAPALPEPGTLSSALCGTAAAGSGRESFITLTRSRGDLSRRRYTVVQGQEISLNTKLLSHVWIKDTGARLGVAVLMTHTRFKRLSGRKRSFSEYLSASVVFSAVNKVAEEFILFLLRPIETR